MHPALSIVLFTGLSGAGYGLLFLLALGVGFGALPGEASFVAVALGLALAAIVGGLLCSTAHLGHPERAWRALSQWRSSWLSREGVAALATFPPALLFGGLWLLAEGGGALGRLAALLTALGCAATVFCTARIYASLKTVRQWRHPLVTPLYLCFALASGAVLLTALLAGFGAKTDVAASLAGALLAAAWLGKLRLWRDNDRAASTSTAETATGLGALGQVRLLEPPHSEDNYLLREMGYRVARKHAGKLRRLAAVAGLSLPLLCLLAVAAGVGAWALPLASLAALGTLLGILIERWLFFAEARHTVVLFYGRPA